MCFVNNDDPAVYGPDPGLRIGQQVVTVDQIQKAADSGGPFGAKGLAEKKHAQLDAAALRLSSVPPVPVTPGAFALQIAAPRTGIPQLRTGSF